MCTHHYIQIHKKVNTAFSLWQSHHTPVRGARHRPARLLQKDLSFHSIVWIWDKSQNAFRFPVFMFLPVFRNGKSYIFVFWWLRLRRWWPFSHLGGMCEGEAHRWASFHEVRLVHCGTRVSVKSINKSSSLWEGRILITAGSSARKWKGLPLSGLNTNPFMFQSLEVISGSVYTPQNSTPLSSEVNWGQPRSKMVVITPTPNGVPLRTFSQTANLLHPCGLGPPPT